MPEGVKMRLFRFWHRGVFFFCLYDLAILDFDFCSVFFYTEMGACCSSSIFICIYLFLSFLSFFLCTLIDFLRRTYMCILDSVIGLNGDVWFSSGGRLLCPEDKQMISEFALEDLIALEAGGLLP